MGAMTQTPDTIRVLVDWKCNLKCSYCCNEQDRFRSQFTHIQLSAIDFSRYETTCISGGEPLMFMNRVVAVSERARLAKSFVVLYTNGILLTPAIADMLMMCGIQAVNVGLHYAAMFPVLIPRITEALVDTGISLRFHANEEYSAIQQAHPDNAFRLWKMDDCDRENEERVILDWKENQQQSSKSRWKSDI
jgi:organic radical activating enzyme